jgi:peptidoglycan/LPS O-acetylase OafA/YrhL
MLPIEETIVAPTREAPTNANASHHLPWLDWLRFLAAFAVLVSHSRVMSFVEFGVLRPDDKTTLVGIVFALTRIGPETVILFFVLSGYLVGGRAIDRMAKQVFRPTDYAIDRLTRVFVPLLPALVLTAVIGVAVGNEDTGPLVFLGNLLGLQQVFVPSYGSNGPLWSLSYEIWFYVLAGAFGVACSRSRLHLGSAAVVVLALAVFCKLSTVYLFCWLVGAFAFVRPQARATPGRVLAALALIALPMTAYQLGRESVSVNLDRWRCYLPSLEVSSLLFACGYALLIQQLVLIRPRTRGLCALERAGGYCAGFSYTLYLTHYPVIQLLSYLGFERAASITASSVMLCLLRIAIGLGVAFALYLLFERHTGSCRRFLKARIEGSEGGAA